MKKYIRRAFTAMVAAAVLVTSSGVMTLADSIQAETAETGTSETTEGIPAETVPANETEPVTDGEGDTGTGQVPDKEPSDGQTSGGQTPEEGNSDGEIETPEEAVYASLTTGVYAEDREGTRSAVKEVLVRLYDAGTYDADAETNPVLAELSIDEEETGTLPELTPGEYRIEYVIQNEQFPAEDYEGKELPEGTDYEVRLAEDEAAADTAAGKPEKERDYFAVIPSIQLTGERELTLELVEKQPEGEPDGSLSDKPGSSEDQGTVQDPEEVQNPAEETKPDREDTGEPEAPGKDAEEAPAFDLSEALTLKELQEMDADLAGAAQEKDGGFTRFWDSLFSSEDWSFDVYYVDQEDRYEVELTDNFNLKYQAEFHNSRDLAAGDVEIRMPASLCLDRDEEQVVPTDIAVPEGTPEDPAESRTTSFNYYIDEKTGELVFFNYRKMEAGTNAAFQVLYKNVDIMGLTDGTSWELTPSARVKEADQDPETEDPVWEERTGTALTGTINSQVKLGTVTKTPYTIAGKSYSPGLYTEEQVSRLVEGGLPEKFAGDKFPNYKYVVWEIKLTGNASQPWSLAFSEDALIAGEAGGEVVGFDRVVTEKEADGETLYELMAESRSRSFDYKFRVVTAYPAERVESGTSLENTVTAVLTPLDGVDEPETKSAAAKWSYTDYQWVYGDDNIGIIKGIRTGEEPVERQTYKGWLDAYAESVRTGEDMAPFPMATESQNYGYEKTHVTEGGDLGEPIEGISYKVTTYDDFVYAYANTGDESAYAILDDQDYYFSNVQIVTTDVGYDPWEDEETAPEESGGMKIWAMYAGSDQWTEVAEVPWNPSGVMVYRFTQEQLARQPWRVKVEHESVNYFTVCGIATDVTLRHDSPKMQQILAAAQDEGEYTQVTIEHLNGVTGEWFDHGVSQGYYHSQSTEDGNYSEPELEEVTRELYGGMLLQRSSAFAELTSLIPQAGAFKSTKSANDPDNGRVDLTYTLTAYNSYNVYGEEAMYLLRNAGVAGPGRGEVVFYDLLPYGVKFDPSKPIQASRITDVNYSQGSYILTKDNTQVELTVDPAADVIPDYKGTGRTLVKFHVDYTGTDPSVYTDYTVEEGGVKEQFRLWLSGWQVSFGAYYDWKDASLCNPAENIAAFQPEDSNDPLLGTEDEVMADNGQEYPADLDPEKWEILGADLDGDGDEAERNVLYASDSFMDDLATSSETGLTKQVRADSDRFGSWQDSADVALGEGYSYEITVANASGTLRDMVVFDRLENAGEDRAGNETFDGNWWYGTFDGITTTGLAQAGIAPVIYYNADRSAKIPTGAEKPGDILTEANGWMTKEAWEAAGKTAAEVKAVAVDLSTGTDGQPFVLGENESVTFRIRMVSPAEDESLENSDHGNTYTGTTPAEHAYNNASYYSFADKTGTGATLPGNSVEVSQGERERIEVEKELTGEVPEAVQETTFWFTAFLAKNGEQIPYSNKEYELYQKNSQGAWEPVEENRIHATDGAGEFSLKAGQKAVFYSESGDSLAFEEMENPFWKAESEKTESEASAGQEAVTRWLFTNEYRPVLYAQKELEAVPEDVDTSKAAFTFQILTENESGEMEPLADAEFWYVDSARTDGGIPSKVTDLGEDGVGYTDQDGTFTIQEGQIIALFPGRTGTVYELREIQGTEDDWLCQEDTVTGTLPVQGDTAAITNIYKWKDLLITKTLTHQDAEECNQEFTFRITKVDGETEVPVWGNEWVLLNADGTESNTKGILETDGTFTCACAGQTVKVKGLEAGETYLVTETDSGELYRPVNGTEEVELPIYSSSQSVEITNDYLMRPLSVTKMVTTGPGTLVPEEQTFTMTVKVNGVALSKKAYTLTEQGTVVGNYHTDVNGQFQLKNGQTATFQEAGRLGDSFEVTETKNPDYPQVYPANKEPHTGELEGEGSQVTFVNGTDGGLTISKTYEGVDKAGTDYVNLMKSAASEEGQKLREEAAVTLTLKAEDTQGNTWIWPKTDTTIQVVDQLTGDPVQATWPAGESFRVQPWKTLLIPADALKDVVSYELREDARDQHRMFQLQDGQWLEISQKSPEKDQPVEGTPKDTPVAELVNQAEGISFEGSQIEKRMAPGSNEVTVGAELIWHLEEYNGITWVPAEGVSYAVFDENGITSDRIQTTDADGELLLVKTEAGYPKVRFLDAEVRINLYEGAQTGDYRLVEALEESDESWGLLAGYGSADDLYAYSPSLSPEKAVAFVNTNRNTPVEIEKVMEQPSNAEFTMILERVVSATQNPVTSPDQIVASEPGAGIEYTVYDAETEELIRTDVTGSGGEIRLHAGQYARLMLPDGTLWTVKETRSADHTLKGMTGTSEKLTKLEDNLMLIRQEAEVIPGALEVLVTEEEVHSGAALEKGNFTVNVVYSDGSRKELQPKEYTLTPDTAVDSAGPMDVTVQWTEGNLEATVTLNVVGEIEITREMVEAGVTDAEIGKVVDIKSGEVTIPEYIIWKGNKYQVVGIGDFAYGSQTSVNVNQEITGIHFPDSVQRIGNNAFSWCKNLTGPLELPAGLTEIGESAFSSCSGLTGALKIPEGVISIGEYAFANCTGFSGELIILDSVTSIGESAFVNCTGLTGKLKIPGNVTSIAKNTFSGCSGFTGELDIPNGVTSIGEDAFRSCSGFTGDLDIPNSVTSIGGGAFSQCSGFTGALIIPDNITIIEDSTFSGCSGFTGKLIIPNNVTSIGVGAFESCKGFTGDLIIPDNVTNIGRNAFSGCSGFTGKLQISRVSTIEYGTFYGCNGFTGALVIPDSVKEIKGREDRFMAMPGAFEGCAGFESLTIPEGVEVIGVSAFNGCTGIKGELELPNSVTTIAGRAFANCTGLTGTLTIPSGVIIMDVTQAAFDEEPAPGAFEGCTGLKSLVIEEGAKKIGKRAFYGCTGLQGELRIPNSVPEIGEDAFTSTNFDKISVDNTPGSIGGAPWGWDGTVTWLR